MNPTHTTTTLTVITFSLGYLSAYSQNYFIYLITPVLTALISYLFPHYNHLTKKQLFKCLITTHIFGIIFGYYLYKPTWDIFGIYLCISTVRYYGQFQLINFFHHYELQWHSFLIYHSQMYMITNFFLILEHVITKYLIKAEYKQYHILMFPAFLITIAATILRIVAFFTAKSNFTHKVSYNKKQNHQLVTNGVYSIFRHPSYTGFFYYSIFSMVMIGNFVSAVAFGIILSIFFEDRIHYEEHYLLTFFGDSYENYRRSTSIFIPYLPAQIKKYLPVDA